MLAVFATVAAVSGIGATHAADYRRPVPAPLPVAAVWTGVYAGVIGGYAWGHLADHPNPLNPKGGVWGAEIGANWQQDPNWVFGVEANWFTGDLTDSYISGQIRKVEILPAYTLRARLGFVHNVTTLFYLTAGFAWQRDEYSFINKNNGNIIQHGTQTHSGTVLGIGVEHMLTDRLSAKAELLQLDLNGSPNVPTFNDIKQIGRASCRERV